MAGGEIRPDSLNLNRTGAQNIQLERFKNINVDPKIGELLANPNNKPSGLPDNAKGVSYNDGSAILEFADGTNKKVSLTAAYGLDVSAPADYHEGTTKIIENLDFKPDIEQKFGDKGFIPLDSELGKELSRQTLEYRPGIDGKYTPVYGESDALGRREILGYKETNILDTFKNF